MNAFKTAGQPNTTISASTDFKTVFAKNQSRSEEYFSHSADYLG